MLGLWVKVKIMVGVENGSNDWGRVGGEDGGSVRVRCEVGILRLGRCLEDGWWLAFNI